VPHYVKSWPWPSRKAGTTLLNKDKTSLWLPGRECIWKQHGVWDVKDGKPAALKRDYFTKHPVTNKKISFDQDCYLPFILSYTQAIHQVNPALFSFFEPIPNEDPPRMDHEALQNTVVYAPHWYDLKALFTKVRLAV
jgi:hypothetical protein